MNRFHQYIYGRKFTVATDHKPLLGLLQQWKQIPEQASPRMTRWALKLAAYDYELIYKAGSEIGNADGLSRLPVPLSESEASLQLSSIEEYSICKVIFHNDIVSFEEIRKASTNDAILARVRRCVSQGWPETVEDDLLPYYRRKTKLSTEKESLCWGSRIVIPETFPRESLDHTS